MRIEVDEINKVIKVPIPLTEPTGKMRVKIRNNFTEYGSPTPTRQIPFSLKHYVEWQIGYDVDKSNLEKLALSTLPNTEFGGANGKYKALYELSEYLYYFVQWGLITKEEIRNLFATLETIEGRFLIEEEFLGLEQRFNRTKSKEFLEAIFYPFQAKYSRLIWNLNNFSFGTLVEIEMREKQRAVGVQPMLYICLPLERLQPAPGMLPLLKRTAQPKEYAYLLLADGYQALLLELMWLFGILSADHKHDVLEILKVILCTKKN
ncbi:R.Pab1 family restriction endonuclease [Helicobacter suis]|uniref:R.Pab1 family restriction endonuclease n=1 Tax=Helicobacter suis TaxID=104628 RepID=UPI0013D47023|nr:R.Pab1 family restriction endonuclease [Helicobacter suis]